MSQEKNGKVNSQKELSQKEKDRRITEIYFLLNPDSAKSFLRIWGLEGVIVNWNDAFDTIRLLIVEQLHDLESALRENEVLRERIRNLQGG